MKTRFAFLLCVAALGVLTGCGGSDSAPSSGQKLLPGTLSTNEREKLTRLGTNDVAILSIGGGHLIVELWPEVATNTVENFKKLARSGFYDNTLSHRLIKGFMIQLGDPLTKDKTKETMWGQGDPGYKIKAEFNERPHLRGVLSMARGPDPDSGGSQFFICFTARPDLDRQYTTFGKVIFGDDVLTKLEATPCGPSPGGDTSRPLQPVELKSVRIVPANTVQ